MGAGTGWENSLFGDRLRIAIDMAKARGVLDRDMSQNAVARAAGTSSAVLSRYLRRKRPHASGPIVLRLARLLGVGFEWLYMGTDAGPVAALPAPPSPKQDESGEYPAVPRALPDDE